MDLFCHTEGALRQGKNKLKNIIDCPPLDYLFPPTTPNFVSLMIIILIFITLSTVDTQFAMKIVILNVCREFEV